MSEPCEVRPAMTPEEWRTLQFTHDGGELEVTDDVPPEGGGGLRIVSFDSPDWVTAVVLPESRHALAALALHGQPFGFTWADVDLLRGLASWSPHEWPGADDRLRNLADRIEALLPPREEEP